MSPTAAAAVTAADCALPPTVSFSLLALPDSGTELCSFARAGTYGATRADMFKFAISRLSASISLAKKSSLQRSRSPQSLSISASRREKKKAGKNNELKRK